MATRRILEKGRDELLRKRSRPVEKFDKRLWTLLDDMADTMYDADGAGLAAVQVGVLKRCVVIDVGEGLIELINPEIVESEGEMINAEGCLSVPGRRGTVKRPERVSVKAVDREGKPMELSGEGYLSIAISHELDHLDGILYTDKMIEDVTEELREDAAQ